jgi:hypothetical protein
MPGLAGAAKRTRAARPGTLELIAHAWCLALHSLHCTDKCPMGRHSLWPRLTLAPDRLAIPALLSLAGVAVIRGKSADP